MPFSHDDTRDSTLKRMMYEFAMELSLHCAQEGINVEFFLILVLVPELADFIEETLALAGLSDRTSCIDCIIFSDTVDVDSRAAVCWR